MPAVELGLSQAEAKSQELNLNLPHVGGRTQTFELSSAAFQDFRKGLKLDGFGDGTRI